MSSKVLVSKSPLILGRFEWDFEIPRFIAFGSTIVEDKKLQIHGQDGNTHTIGFQIVLTDYWVLGVLASMKDERYITYMIRMDKPNKGDVHI